MIKKMIQLFIELTKMYHERQGLYLGSD